jgi:hypothetical protein
VVLTDRRFAVLAARVRSLTKDLATTILASARSPRDSLGLLSAAVLGGVMAASANDDNDNRNHDRDNGWEHVLDTRAREILIGFRIAPVALDTRGTGISLRGHQ